MRDDDPSKASALRAGGGTSPSRTLPLLIIYVGPPPSRIPVSAPGYVYNINSTDNKQIFGSLVRRQWLLCNNYRPKCQKQLTRRRDLFGPCGHLQGCNTSRPNGTIQIRDGTTQIRDGTSQIRDGMTQKRVGTTRNELKRARIELWQCSQVTVPLQELFLVV